MNEDRNEERKSYVKPEIRRVTLKAEESLAAGCKTISGSAPAAGPPCTASTCMNLGS